MVHDLSREKEVWEDRAEEEEEEEDEVGVYKTVRTERGAR
jgi:hypothetical protein